MRGVALVLRASPQLFSTTSPIIAGLSIRAITRTRRCSGGSVRLLVFYDRYSQFRCYASLQRLYCTMIFDNCTHRTPLENTEKFSVSVAANRCVSAEYCHLGSGIKAHGKEKPAIPVEKGFAA